MARGHNIKALYLAVRNAYQKRLLILTNIAMINIIQVCIVIYVQE